MIRSSLFYNKEKKLVTVTGKLFSSIDREKEERERERGRDRKDNRHI